MNNTLSNAEIVQNAVLLPLCHSGIYYLLDGDEIVYIGQSRNVSYRIAAHISEGQKIFNRYLFFPCNIEDLNATECEEIIKYKPKYNKTIPISDGSEYVSARKLSKILGINLRSLRAIIRKNGVKSHDFGNKHFYKVSDFI